MKYFNKWLLFLSISFLLCALVLPWGVTESTPFCGIQSIDNWVIVFFLFLALSFISLMGSVLLPLAKDAAGTKQISKMGVSTVGTLIFARATGTSNGKTSPQIELTIQIMTNDHKSVIGTARRIFDIKEVVMYIYEGMQLPVRYDRDNPENMTLDFKNIKLLVQDEYAGNLGSRNNDDLDKMNIVKTGTQMRGTVINVQPTGNMVNHIPEIMIQFKIMRPDGRIFTATVTKALEQSIASHFSVHSVFVIFFRLEDEQNIVIGTKLWR